MKADSHSLVMLICYKVAVVSVKHSFIFEKMEQNPIRINDSHKTIDNA